MSVYTKLKETKSDPKEVRKEDLFQVEMSVQGRHSERVYIETRILVLSPHLT